MTTVQAIGVLIMRVFALFIIVLQLPLVMLAAAPVLEGAEGAAAASELMPELIYQSGVLLIGLLLLFLSRSLAGLITPGSEQKNDSSAVSPEEMLSIGSFMIGVLLLALHLPEVVLQLIRTAIAYTQNLDMRVSVSMRYWHDVWAIGEKALILLIAFWLVLRPAGLGDLYRRLRTAGQGPATLASEPSKPE